MIRTSLIVVLLAAVVGAGLAVIQTKHQSRRLFIELHHLQVAEDNLQIEWGQLQLEQSTLATEAVVDHAARTRLDMMIPDSNAVVYLTR